ncbi:hypothetical protein [Cellulomonas sp. HD19AZ1]|uniref:hypothetical protein n=1 Tax=Cellulomonas sp. HD19AZ1 TaxID=2559593 RepID=UPI001070B8E2|nr:hypothetical protein [Cellulomonas sp. HD19AZ1]TFH68148.1 hypothetical protein E4A51_18050 [Cellulomonas sp. HD19AZ1]
MATTRTADRTAARERARQRRLELDAEQIKRDQQVDEAVADFYAAADEIDDLRRKIAAAEQEQSDAIGRLLALDEKPKRAQALLAIDAAEWNRLKPPSPSTLRGAAPSAPSDATSEHR